MKLVNLLIGLFVFQGFSQSLPEYLTIAIQNNPLLQAEAYLVKSAAASVDAAGNLPETQIKIAPFIAPVQTRVGNQQLRISLMQQFPWFGILKKQKQAQRAQMKSTESMYKLARENITLKVKLQYHLLCHLKEKKTILEKNKALLEEMKKIALQELKTEQSSLIHILKITIKQNEIENRIQIVTNELLSQIKSFRWLLGVDENYDVKIHKDDLKILEKIPALQSNLKNHLQLQSIAHRQESLAALQSIASKKRMPQFSLGMDYVFVSELPAKNIAENGRDIVMPMLGITIPIFSKKHSATQKKLAWQEKSLERKAKDLENTLSDSYQKTRKNLENLKNSILVLENNIAETQKINQLLLSNYTGNQSYFREFLETQQWQLDFQLKVNDAQRKYADGIAKIHYLNAN